MLLKCCIQVKNYHASCQFFILLLFLELIVSTDVLLALRIQMTVPLALGTLLLL